MTNYAIPHNTFEIAQSITNVLRTQNVGVLNSTNNFVENKIVKRYVDNNVLSVPKDDLNAEINVGLESDDFVITESNGVRPFTAFTEISDPDNLVTYDNGNVTYTRYILNDVSLSQETVTTYPGLMLNNYLGKTYIIEFSGTFKQSASDPSKYHEVVLVLSRQDEALNYPETFNRLFTFKIDHTQERPYSGLHLFSHGFYVANYEQHEYTLTAYIKRTGDASNRIYYKNVKIKLTQFQSFQT